MNKPCQRCAQWDKPDTEDKYSVISLKWGPQSSRIIETERRLALLRARRGEGSCCSTGTEFILAMMSLYTDCGDGCTAPRMHLTPLNYPPEVLLCSCSVVSGCWRPHGLRYAVLPVLHYLPVCSNSCPLSRWRHPSHLLLPLLQMVKMINIDTPSPNWHYSVAQASCRCSEDSVRSHSEGDWDHSSYIYF